MVEVLSERVFSEVALTTPHPVNFRFVFYIFLFLRLETSISVFCGCICISGVIEQLSCSSGRSFE